MDSRRLAPLLAVLLLATVAATAWGQAGVTLEDGPFRITLTVDKLVYALLDTVHVTYTVENVADTTAQVPVCCCGFQFYAVRDSACTLGDEDCQIAGCDACETCFQEINCKFDPCFAFDLGPGESREFTWDWDRVVCELDIGFDEIFGNIGTFRIEAGYRQCETGNLVSRLSIGIDVLTSVPAIPATWGSLKARYPDPAAPRRPREPN